MRIATWNVNSLKARLPRVEEWLAEAQPDVLCMQETKLSDDAFPAMTFAALGYDSVHHGQGQWNGVAILSRVGITDVVDGFGDGGEPDGEARLLTATCGGVRVATVYVPNGREVGHEHYFYKLGWLSRLRAHLEATADRSSDVVVCGDFNVAPDDRDVWDAAACHGGTHVSEPEREALAGVEAWGLTDVLRQRYDQDGLFSWWDYQAGAFHKHWGMRIDLLLASAPLAERLSWVLVDRNARKGSKPSDHAPLVAEFTPATVGARG
ncbi:MAG: xthA [Actinomycetia bacterium]|nr:xthA [Actinomycetes bacterium]